MPHAAVSVDRPTLPGGLDRRRLLTLAAAGLAGALLPGCAWGGGAGTSAGAAVLATPGADDRRGFLAAVVAGDRRAVAARLEADPSLARATDDAGRSAYLLAHLAGQPAVAALLAARGLELDVVEAVFARDWPRVEALIEADPSLADALHPVGGTPLHAAALNGEPDMYRLRSLGCDSDAVPAGGNGFSPARTALLGPDPVGAWLAATDLLSNGGRVDVPQRGGDSLLHGAVRRRDPRLVRLVIRKGADVAARDEQGRSARDLALALDWPAGVVLLDGHRAIPRDHSTSRFRYDANRQRVVFPDTSHIPREVQSRVTSVSHFNAQALGELLAEDPTRVFSISTDDELAIEACGHTGHRVNLQQHVDHGAPLSLPSAISLGDLAHARFLLEEDPARIHERGPHDFALMWYPAIGGGSIEAAELLASFGTPLDQDSVGLTALHWAARRGHVDLCAWLLERGADVDAVGHRWDKAGQTPLEVALVHDQPAVATLLRQRGAREPGTPGGSSPSMMG